MREDGYDEANKGDIVHDDVDSLADLMSFVNDASSSGLKATKARCRDNRKSQMQISTQLHGEPLSSLLTRIDNAYANNITYDTSLRSSRTAPSIALLERLKNATLSIEHLSQLIDTFHSLLEGIVATHAVVGLDGDSLFGVYLRRICLGMEELPFEAMSRLWVCFREFVLEASRPGVTADEMKTSESVEWVPSSSQVERILKKKCLNADLLFDNFDGAGDNATNKNAGGIDLLQTHPETPSLHFLFFYSSLLQKERCALESLHRYFDYGLIHERKERVERSLAGTTPNVTSNTTAPMTNNAGGITTSVNNEGNQQRPNPNAGAQQKTYKESNIMQYAAIILAQTYHRFHYKSLALQAAQEAIRVAQQSGDEECVLFAQGWLTYINNEDAGMLRKWRDRALERGLGSLAAGAALELGRKEGYSRISRQYDDLDNEEEHGACLAWESIQNAGRAATPSGGRLATVRGGFGSQYITDVDILTSSEALSLLGRQNMAISGLWDSTGHSSMASLSSFAALHGFGSELSPEDTSSAMSRILTSLTNGPGLNTWTSEGASVTQHECVYAATLNSLLALHGKVSSSEWVPCTASILHEWSVRSCDLSIAQSLQYILANHASFSTSPSTAVEAALISLSRATQIHLRVGDYAAAKTATHHACALAAKNSLLIQQGWHLLQLALIDLEASTAAPSSNPSIVRALMHLLECLHLARKYSLDPLRAVALSTLARIILCMGRYQKARAMLHAAMPLVVQHGHIWFHAEACLTLAKCNLAEARARQSKTDGGLRSRENKSSRNSTDALQCTALSQLENAASLFNQIEDVQRLQQTFYLQAVTCNAISGMQSQRDECATKFKQLSRKKQTGSKVWTVVHGILAGDPDQLR